VRVHEFQDYMHREVAGVGTISQQSWFWYLLQPTEIKDVPSACLHIMSHINESCHTSCINETCHMSHTNESSYSSYAHTHDFLIHICPSRPSCFSERVLAHTWHANASYDTQRKVPGALSDQECHWRLYQGTRRVSSPALPPGLHVSHMLIYHTRQCVYRAYIYIHTCCLYRKTRRVSLSALVPDLHVWHMLMYHTRQCIYRTYIYIHTYIQIYRYVYTQIWRVSSPAFSPGLHESTHINISHMSMQLPHIHLHTHLHTNIQIRVHTDTKGLFAYASIWSMYITHFDVAHRGVIVVSIVFGGGEVCIAYFGIFVRVLLGWLSNRSLYQTFPVNPSLLYQAVGTQANDEKPFQFDLSIWKVFWQRLLCVPTALYKRDGFTENVWYKLRLLSQPSNTRTNILKHASGPISWLIQKRKQYKLRPPQIL